MGRPKKIIEKKKVPAARKDPRIEEIYEEAVTFDCPVRGKVTQLVKIKRFKPASEQPQKNLMVSINELTSKIEEMDDGLSIYSDGEELGLKVEPEDS